MADFFDLRDHQNIYICNKKNLINIKHVNNLNFISVKFVEDDEEKATVSINVIELTPSLKTLEKLFI